MIDLSIVRESAKRDAMFQSTLSKSFSMEFKNLDDLTSSKPGPYSLVDFEFMPVSGIPALKEWIRAKSNDAKVVFVINRASHLQTTRAFAIGATDIIHYPVE